MHLEIKECIFTPFRIAGENPVDVNLIDVMATHFVYSLFTLLYKLMVQIFVYTVYSHYYTN